MGNLLEDYKLKLNSVVKMIGDLPTNCPSNTDYIRLVAKRECYKSFITELERCNSTLNGEQSTNKLALLNNPNVIDLLVICHEETKSNGVKTFQECKLAVKHYFEKNNNNAPSHFRS